MPEHVPYNRQRRDKQHAYDHAPADAAHSSWWPLVADTRSGFLDENQFLIDLREKALDFFAFVWTGVFLQPLQELLLLCEQFGKRGATPSGSFSSSHVSTAYKFAKTLRWSASPTSLLGLK
jgi:hypothetical protein